MTDTAASDARKRAIRTFLQGLAFDVLAALVLLVFPLVSAANDWNSIDWAVLGFLAAKTVAVTVLSFVMRYFSIGKGTLPDTGTTKTIGV